MVRIDFNPIVSFKSQTQNQVKSSENSVAANLIKDSSVPEEAPKKSKGIKNAFAGVWKFFTTAGTMIEATAKGLFYGTLTALAVLTTAFVTNFSKALKGSDKVIKDAAQTVAENAPKIVEKSGETVGSIFRHPLKHVGKAGKILAGIAGTLVLGYHIVTGKMNANQKTAVIDHKLKVGHRE